MAVPKQKRKRKPNQKQKAVYPKQCEMCAKIFQANATCQVLVHLAGSRHMEIVAARLQRANPEPSQEDLEAGFPRVLALLKPEDSCALHTAEGFNVSAIIEQAKQMNVSGKAPDGFCRRKRQETDSRVRVAVCATALAQQVGRIAQRTAAAH